MTDLSFGDGRVVVPCGRSEFRAIPPDEPEVDGYVHTGSDLDDRDASTAARARDLSACHGRALILVHDRRARTLDILSDRYGHLPFFTERNDGTVRFASRIDALGKRAGSARRLNIGALADALLLNVPLERRTLIEGIEAFPAAHRVTIDLAGGTTTEKRTWDPAVLLMGEQRPLADMEEELFDSFLEGFDRSVQGERVAVTLSGGIDSRCLLAAALHRNLEAKAFNCSVPGSRAARYAETMARRTHVTYGAFPVGDEFTAQYADRLRGVVRLTEGMTFASEVECHWLRERLSDVSVVLHGAFAELTKVDQMHAYYADDTVLQAGREAVAQVIWQRHQPQLERCLQLIAPELREGLRRVAHQNLTSRIDRIEPRLSSDQAMQVMYIEELLSKLTKCSSTIWNQVIRTRFPFGYPPYVDGLLRTRSVDRRGQRFQMRLLQRTSPFLFRFPNANTGLRVDASDLLIRAALALDRVRRVLFGSRESLGHFNHAHWVTQMRPTPEEILLDPSSRRLLDVPAIERLLHDLRAPLAASWNPVKGLMVRGTRQRQAQVIQKALMLRLWMDQTQVTIG